MSARKAAVLTALAAAGSFVAELLGGWDAALKTLVIFMAADYITGLVVAGVFKNSGKSSGGALSSSAGFAGLCRKFAVLLLILIAARLDSVIEGTGYLRNTVVIFFCANEGLSILENIGLMGVPYPAFLTDMLQALKSKSEQ